MTDTGPSTPVAVVGDLVIVAPEFEAVQAFDLATGDPRLVPPGQKAQAPLPSSPNLPDGYSFEDGRLSFAGAVIWSGGGEYEPIVRRMGDLTVINDDEYGFLIVDDHGTLLKDLPIGVRNYDATSPVIDGNEVVAVTSEGMLIRLIVDP